MQVGLCTFLTDIVTANVIFALLNQILRSSPKIKILTDLHLLIQ